MNKHNLKTAKYRRSFDFLFFAVKMVFQARPGAKQVNNTKNALQH
jgi:hypothetical protein